MTRLQVYVEGVGVWAQQISNFDALRTTLAGDAMATTTAKPPAALLSPNERRRAPDSVLIAAEVAGQAVAMSGQPPQAMACVFASAYGDQAITDYMCATLAQAPTELSPTRFHNSVQNAPVGYWTIATQCHEPSSAVCAGDDSFGAGLLEAATLACADHRRVLFVCSDTLGQGPVGQLAGSRRAFGSALVLSPVASPATVARMTLHITADLPVHRELPKMYAGWTQDNPSACALPLLVMLATQGGRCVVAVSKQLNICVDLENIRE